MIYEALTGQHPFGGGTIREVVSGQLEGWVASPSMHGVSVPANLERGMMRSIERNPGLRQASADDFMEGLNVQDRIGEIFGGKFCGRAAELAQVEELINSDDPGRMTLVFVSGPSGVGKTAFLAEFSQRLISVVG